ncbi:MAG: efflux RND transporter permease subunit [Flavobacteriaceae bacterium]|jgi:HAE1 family hydrophobic/amphiphilic exporter-1|nr:efflux RND transporter permease subunit [Flavobacteriaceae bacterium]
MLKKIIHRPVLATVISLIIVILGVVGLTQLPMAQFPDIAPPSVTVMASYPGGNAETVLKSVVTPLEEVINGVENMTHIESTASNDGTASITVFFDLETDPDQAAVNVQNRVSQVSGILPAEVLQAGVITQKEQRGMIMIIDLISEDNTLYDETFVQNYARINLVRELKRIKGIGKVQLYGEKDYAMRVWLDPHKLANRGLTPKDVENAIQSQSMEVAAGNLGQNAGGAVQYTLTYPGKYNTPEQFENIVVQADKSGNVLYLKDIARIEFGAVAYDEENKINSQDAVSMAVFQTKGSNANEIQTQVYKVIEDLTPQLPKGLKYNVTFANKNQLDESINQVKSTLIEAFLLVFLIVYIFLQDFRSTLIPAIAVPVSLIGTFFFLNMIGFSINMLTLFALVLAIGIVVDDAIVVVEAVHSTMEHEGLNAKEATSKAMSEISGAIVSITLVMSAVFLPVGFMEGPVGVFYKQFAYTLAIAIMISAVNALTLSPALCALLLKNHHHDLEKDGTNKKEGFKTRFFRSFNAGFTSLTNKYIKGVQFLIKRKVVSLSILIGSIVAMVFLMNTTPKGFIPNEDQGFAMFALSLPPGSSIDRTANVLKEGDEIMRKNPAIKSVTTISGFNILGNAASPAYGMGFISFKDLKERGDITDINVIIANLNKELSVLKEGEFYVFANPTVPGFGDFDGLEMVVQDKRGGSIDDFANVVNQFNKDLGETEEVESAFTMFKADFPMYKIVVDPVKAKMHGVEVSDMMNAVQLFYGSAQVNDFNRFGKQFKVFVQGDAPFRANEDSFKTIYVTAGSGEMIPISSLAHLEKVYGPQAISRHNLFNSIAVNGIIKPGTSTGDAMAAVEKVAAEKLPAGYGIEWLGLSKEEQKSGGQMIFIFGLSLLFIYFILSAQYESYILPLVVLLSLPVGLMGVFVAIGMVGIANNIYVQVGLIMLVGLLAKNAILIVEFAVQKRQSGLSIVESAIEAARLRLRPILMTSFAFVAGLIPLMFVQGSSAQGNHSISIGTAGGMVFGVILGVFIIPVLYIAFQYLQEKISGKPVQEHKKEDTYEVLDHN